MAILLEAIMLEATPYASAPSSICRSAGEKDTVALCPRSGGGAAELLKVSSEITFSLKRTRMRTIGAEEAHVLDGALHGVARRRAALA